MNIHLIKSLVAGTAKQSSIEDLIQGLRNYCLPDNVLPLSKNRYPFESISEKAILSSVIDAILFPEKSGRLSNSIRKYLEIPYDCPINYIIKEAHLDINKVDGNLYDDLINVGFEPDHFSELNPLDYNWCFTLKYEIPHFVNSNRNRINYIDGILKQRSTQAQYLVNSTKDCYGYLEIESYSSKNKSIYKFKPIKNEGIKYFPFKENHFINFNIPSTYEESVKSGIPLLSHKTVDIHVKIPSIYLGIGYEEANNNEMNNLRNLFLLAGFYEIYSEAGNYIYTVQLFNPSEGKKIFKILDDYAKKWGGLSQIKLEICNYFWRKERELSNLTSLSPIPPLVRQ